MASRGLLDTSVFIASESGRPLAVELMPQESAISVVTLAELHGLPVITQDNDFAALEGMTGVVVVSV